MARRAPPRCVLRGLDITPPGLCCAELSSPTYMAYCGAGSRVACRSDLPPDPLPLSHFANSGPRHRDGLVRGHRDPCGIGTGKMPAGSRHERLRRGEAVTIAVGSGQERAIDRDRERDEL